MSKPILSLPRILQMNLGFLGLQFSFGLQQGNMAPIYSYLGAHEAELPLLLLAGPMTGLIVQPIVGAMSDRTDGKWGRRTPYFLCGAMLCALALALMPYSASLLMAASLLWILDAGNNITMEPYRAYVSDRLDSAQHQTGFLTQSAFTGLGQMLAFVTPSILVGLGLNRDAVDAHGIPYTVHAVFAIGAVLSLTTILYSVRRVPELPLTEAERAHIAAQPRGIAATLIEIGSAIRDMPPAMRKLGLMSLFQWSALAAYWAYVIYAIARSVYGTSDPNSGAFHEAVLANGEMAAFYNGVAFVSALALIPVSKRLGPGVVHAACLVAAGASLLVLPHVTEKVWLFPAIIGLGLGWGSVMGNPYAILAGSIPPERTGVYMGIFNMMIVIPMILMAIIVPIIYQPLLNGDPRNMMTLAGLLLIAAAGAVLTVPEGRRGTAMAATPAA